MVHSPDSWRIHVAARAVHTMRISIARCYPTRPAIRIGSRRPSVRDRLSLEETLQEAPRLDEALSDGASSHGEGSCLNRSLLPQRWRLRNRNQE